MRTRSSLRVLAAGLAATCLAASAALAASAQPIAPKSETAPHAVTEDWLLGEWQTGKRAAPPKVEGAAGLTAASSGDGRYLLDLQIYRRSDGRLEAISTARQKANRKEFVTWKSDVVIHGDTIITTPREIVGRHEWQSYTPANFELRRSGDRLVGWSFSRFWVFDNARRIEFMR